MPPDIERFPMVPIRDVVIFPYTKVAFKIGRPSSVAALEQASSHGNIDDFARLLAALLAEQRDSPVERGAQGGG